MAMAFWRLCNRCCSAMFDESSYFPIFVSRDLDRTLVQSIIVKLSTTDEQIKQSSDSSSTSLPLNNFFKCTFSLIFWIIILWRERQVLNSREEDFMLDMHTVVKGGKFEMCHHQGNRE